MQSDNLVIDMESKEEEEEEEEKEEEEIQEDPYSIPLEEPVRRICKRKITLIELLDALNQARKESEEYQLLEKLKKEEKRRLAEKALRAMKGTTLEDPIEKDIREIWERIRQSPKKIVCLDEICRCKDKDDHIKTFLSVLFLVYERKIKVYQRRFPFGKIYIRI